MNIITSTVWITRYALTKGIYSLECELHSWDSELATHGKEGWRQYFYKPDWHLTQAEAVQHAECMRIEKIESLKKQIAKLEKLMFTNQQEKNQ